MKFNKYPSLLLMCTLFLFPSFISAMEQKPDQTEPSTLLQESFSAASLNTLLSLEQYKLIAQTYDSLTGLHGEPGTIIDWDGSIVQYLDANPQMHTIDPFTLTSPLTSAQYYIKVFPAITFPNRAALLFTILELVSTKRLSLYQTPVVATYEPARLRFLREIQKQLEPK